MQQRLQSGADPDYFPGLSPPFADLYGRKKTFVEGSLWQIVFTLGCGFAHGTVLRPPVISMFISFLFCRLGEAQHPARITGHRRCPHHSCLCKLSIALHRYPKNQILPLARNYGTILLSWFSCALRGLCLLFGWSTSGCCFWRGSRSSARPDDGACYYGPSGSLTHVLTVGLTATPGVHPSFLDLGSISSFLLAVSRPWMLTSPP